MTERERFEMEELKRKLLELQGGRCATCWERPARILAHIIPQSDIHLAKYGRDVIHHRLNCRLVCEDPACNDFWNIGCKPHSERLLVAQIRADLEAGKAVIGWPGNGSP